MKFRSVTIQNAKSCEFCFCTLCRISIILTICLPDAYAEYSDLQWLDDANFVNQVSGDGALEVEYGTMKVAGDLSISCSITSTVYNEAFYGYSVAVNVGGNFNVQNCGGTPLYLEEAEMIIGGDWINTNITCNTGDVFPIFSFSLSLHLPLSSSELRMWTHKRKYIQTVMWNMLNSLCMAIIWSLIHRQPADAISLKDILLDSKYLAISQCRMWNSMLDPLGVWFTSITPVSSFMETLCSPTFIMRVVAELPVMLPPPLTCSRHSFFPASQQFIKISSLFQHCIPNIRSWRPWEPSPWTTSSSIKPVALFVSIPMLFFFFFFKFEPLDLSSFLCSWLVGIVNFRWCIVYVWSHMGSRECSPHRQCCWSGKLFVTSHPSL